MNPTTITQNPYREQLSKTFTSTNQKKKLTFLFKDEFNGDFIITSNDWLTTRTATFHIENKGSETYLMLSSFKDQPAFLSAEKEFLLNSDLENLLLAAIEAYEIN